MDRPGALSFFVGMVATSILIVCGFIVIPQAEIRDAPQTSAWLWKDNAIKPVPFHRSLVYPTLVRAEDDSWLVVTHSESSFDVADEHSGVQRFDASRLRFVPLSGSIHMAKRPTPPPDLPGAYALPGDAGLWLEAPGSKRRTFFASAGSWSPGPLVTSSSNLFAAFRDGSRFILVSSPMGATAIGVLVADAPDGALRSVALRGKLSWEMNNLTSYAHAGSKLLVVTDSSPSLDVTPVPPPVVTTHIIDTVSGEVTDGPPIEVPPDAAPSWQLTGEPVPDGLLLVSTGTVHGTGSALLRVVAAALLLLVPGGLWAGFARKRLLRGPFVRGSLCGVALLVLGYVVAVGWSISHASHLW